MNNSILNLLQSGQVRSATCNSDGSWQVDLDIKQQILNYLKNNPTVEIGSNSAPQYLGFLDKQGLEPQQFTLADKVRMVPGGSSVRRGAFIGSGVIIMPPAYVNIGAYVDQDTLIDSHVLIGSCAQIGKRVHLGAGVQIGGVLEPVGNLPVIIEDDCFIGAGAIITEGILIRKQAVIAPGVVLSAAVPIYDTIKQTLYRGIIPEKAVVVPGTRPISSVWGQKQNLSLQCAIIVKYRDEKTDLSLQIEEALK